MLASKNTYVEIANPPEGHSQSTPRISLDSSTRTQSLQYYSDLFPLFQTDKKSPIHQTFGLGDGFQGLVPPC
ncbi:hypothetical protein K435DRAFT_881650 [Dendrothele bispora CBS 962.96]|uniref:Uncharacterized protein n=1 Tax=Dendrothele bispora (strain CBS 962.96) TaxID=1314807 RepID=A0A4S8KI76_DENBC|nr:hypothetical protein K435DRAFT_881650 [Dendrothele bispora CBS 962.96]